MIILNDGLNTNQFSFKDVQFWEFKPIAEDVRKYKLASNLKVVVFND